MKSYSGTTTPSGLSMLRQPERHNTDERSWKDICLFDFLTGDKKPEAVTASNEMEREKNGWGSKGRGNRQFCEPFGALADAEGNVLIR